MPIYTLKDLRAKSGEKYRSLDDEEFVRKYSEFSGIPFEDLANQFGLKQRGFVSEMGRQIAGSVMVDAPKIIGRLEQFVSREMPWLGEAVELGAKGQAASSPARIAAQEDEAELRNEELMRDTGALRGLGKQTEAAGVANELAYEPDLRNRGLFQQTLLSGARGLGNVAMTLPAAVVPGGMVAATGVLFGASQAEETYQKLIAQGVPEDEARAASYKTGAIQGIGEAAATYLGGKAFQAARPVFGALSGRTTSQVAAGMADTSILRPFAKTALVNLIAQPATEVAQDVGTSMVETAAGAKPEDLGEIAKQSAMGAIGLTLLLGPLSFGAHVTRSRNAAVVKAALADDPNIAPELRAQILQQVAAEAKASGVTKDDIDTWVQGQIDMADRQNVALERMESAYRENRQRDFEAAFNAPSGQRGIVPGVDGRPEERELTMGELLQKNMEKITGESKIDLLEKEVKSASEFMAKLRADANDPAKPSVWQFPVSTDLQGTQRGLFAAGPTNLLDFNRGAQPGGTPALTPNQVLAARGPIDTSAPRPVVGGLTETQAMMAAGPQGLTSAQIPVTSPLTQQPTTVESAPAVVTRLFAPTPTGRVSSGRAAATESPQSSEARVATAVPPSAPSAPGAFSAAAPAATTTRRAAPLPKAGTNQIDEELDIDLDEDQNRLKNAVGAVNKVDVSSAALEATVQGAKSVKAPGRVTFDQRLLKGVRDALLRKTGKVSKEYGRREQKIVDAANAFAQSYDAYLAASTNLARNLRGAEEGGVRADTAGNRADTAIANAENITALAADVRTKLAALGVAADNNAKNVEAIVRLVKDTVQAKLAKPGKTKAETLARLKKIDTTLSSAWSAAKRETFMRELTDRADISGQQVRTSEEQQEKGNLTSDMEKAATEGYLRPKLGAGQTQRKEWKAPYKGLAGVMQYLSFNTTPMGKVLALAIRNALVDSANAPNVVFSDTEASRYDPNTNTVYYKRSEVSAEVALHEGFHAALQWFVHQNPNHPAVKQLLKSLDTVLAAKDLTGKAKEVQDVLKKLVGEKRNLDAALELVSYGTTLNEFRRALQAMPSKGVPNEFYTSANALWRAIKRVVQAFLGGGKNVASDVFASAMQLLEGTRTKAMPKQMTGQVLEAKVQSGKQKVAPGTTVPESPEAAASGQNIMMSKEQLSKYTKTLLPRFTLTETLFNQLGWQNWMSTIDKKAIVPLNKFIQKETPKLAQAVSWFNSHYGLESNVVEALVGMKDARRGGTALSEKVAGYIANLPVEKSKALLSYMNDRLDFKRGLRAEPEFTGGDTYMQRLADQAIDNWWKYATEGGMSPKDRAMFAGTKTGNRWVGGLKFTEGFVFPESVAQVASASFGSRKLRELKSRRVKDEVGTDNIRFRTTSDGDPILDDKFVGIYNDTPQLRARLQAGESLANIMPDEFISADLFVEGTPLDDKGQAMLHDPAFTWDLQKKGKAGFQFSAHYDAREAYSVKKALDVANAFQNTMTLLANSYASNNFAKSLYDMGTTKIGNDVIRDGSAVVFDDLDQLNQALNGEGEGANFKPQKDRTKWTYEIKPDKVIRISSDEAKSERAKGLFRNRNQWVLVPKGRDGEVYGALSGKIVNGSVWAAIQDASDRRPVINVPYANDIMRFFKSSKTVYLPSTWVSNVATNVMFAIADDIPLSTLPHAARLYAAATIPADARKKLGLTMTPAEEELMVKVLNSNALLGTFASDEIKKSITDAMVANLNGPENSLWSRMVQMAGLDKARIEAAEKFAGTAKDKTAAINEFMTEWYAAQDNIFRVASVLNYLGKASDASMDINDAVVYRAGKHARDAFLDYDIDSKAIRIMRQTAFPFISFPYAATKLVGRLVVHAPWKLVNIYAAAMIADAMLSAMADDDDEETRRTGPERYRERLLGGFGPHAYFRIPLMGDSENPVYYHVGKYLFASSLLDTSPNGFMGISWFPSAISPGGPFVSGILATVGGIDPFDGKPISDATATDFEKVTDRLKYLQSLMTPNLPFVNAKETEKFIDIAKGRTDLPAGSTSLALARYLGLRMYNYNVDAELEKQDRAAKAIEADYKKAINKLKRKTERMEDPDWDEFYAEEEKLLQRMEKRIAELRGEEYEEE